MSHGRLVAGTGALTVAVVIFLAVLLPGGDDRMKPTRQDQVIVETASRELTYPTVSDAWAQARLGNAAPLEAIKQQVPLRFRAAHDEGEAVILTFAGTEGGCVDLVSTPASTSVNSRAC